MKSLGTNFKLMTLNLLDSFKKCLKYRSWFFLVILFSQFIDRDKPELQIANIRILFWLREQKSYTEKKSLYIFRKNIFLNPYHQFIMLFINVIELVGKEINRFHFSFFQCFFFQSLLFSWSNDQLTQLSQVSDLK